MNIYQHINDLPSALSNCIIALGNFDGTHIGHQELLKNAINESKNSKKPFVLITFSPNPNKFFNPSFRYIHSPALRYKTFEDLGVSECCEFTFNQEFSKLSPIDFIKIICDKIKPSKIITGYNFTFGHKKAGNRDTLHGLAPKYGFTYQPIEEIKFNSKTVSSSYIRNLISTGRVKYAAKLLSKPFILEGQVKRGEGNASKMLNAPTANIDIDFETIIKPLNGVYLVRATHNNSMLYGVANIGNRPTFKGKTIELEVHIIDFSENIYDAHLKVELISLIRLERKFDSIEILKEQIIRDINTAKYLVRNFDRHLG